MKPQQSVFNMLAKANTKQHGTPVKVNFAVADDLKKAYTALEKGNDSIEASREKAIQKINAVLADSKAKVGSAIDAFEISIAKWEELGQPVVAQKSAFEKAAKELGMAPGDSPVYKEAQRVWQDYDSYLQYYMGQLNELNSLYKSLKSGM